MIQIQRKEKNYGTIITPSRRTTQSVRRDIQLSKESIAKLAHRFGIDPKTVVKWKNRGFTHDAAMGYKQQRTTISEAASRRLPLCLAGNHSSSVALRALYRCLKRNGCSTRPIASEETKKKASGLIEGINAQYLLADRSYDIDSIIAQANEQKMQVVILPKKNRKEQRSYDHYLYKIRHLVETAFLHLKAWRGVAMRYAKRTSSFLTIVQIRCLFLWLKVL